MSKIFLITIIVSTAFYSCSPRSYCFFNVKERTVYLTDNKNDSIRSVTISSENPALIFKKNVNISPPVRSFKFSADSIINQQAYLLITTNNQIWYRLRLKEKDWSKDTIFKFRYLIR